MFKSPEFTVSLTQGNWDLHRKGSVDQARHAEKLKDAIRGNLPEIVSSENIIMSDGKHTVKVPIRSIDHPRFKYDTEKERHTGAGTGDSKVGDPVAPGPDQSSSGRGAGREPGIDYIEVGITVDELAEMVFEDLRLPNLQQKGTDEIETTTYKFTERRRTGPLSNLDKRRTVFENIARNARLRRPRRFAKISEEDLRFRTWTQTTRRENNAVVIAMRDVSASMGEFEKYITRSFYFWMVRFLRTKYNNVKIVFITHHTEAQEVDEGRFFNLGESGGTRVSSAYELSLQIINARFDPSRWNIYPFHFSDGDNWGEDDNRRCLGLVEKHLAICNIFGYGEIDENPAQQLSTLMKTFYEIADKRFVGVTITQKEDVYPALQRFFGEQIREGAVNRA